MIRLLMSLSMVLMPSLAPAQGADFEALLKQARDVYRQGNVERAADLASQAIAAEPADARGYILRGQLHAAQRQSAAAIGDFSKAIELDPKEPALRELRGSEQFKLGKFAESIADFDAEIKLAPAREREHWKRGISYYYAGAFDDGRKQFEGYQTFDDNDVENAVWRFLCMARASGVADARAKILKIKDDRRVPMMQVYELFAGRSTVEDVLKAVENGQPAERELYQRRFYAHLYLGLYHEVIGQRDKAREHVTLAAEKYPIEHYMADVARVHAKLLTK